MACQEACLMANMDALIAIFFLTLLLYICKILTYKRAWEQYAEIVPATKPHSTSISVVIAFRNEISTLEALLTALGNQHYPKALFEVILVNDHSDDGSEVIARRYCRESFNFKLIGNYGDQSGKKSALQLGMNQASHELIVITDADCTMGEEWLATFATFYEEKRPDMILGLVDMNAEEGFFRKYQETEFISLIASGAGAAAMRRPVYCNAACMAFTRDLYNSIDDPLQQKAISGDDTLFMHQVKKRKDKKILLLKSAAAVVETRAPGSWKEYQNQRRRWISKSAYYHDAAIIYTAVLVLLMNLWLVVSALLVLTRVNFWVFPVMLVLKALTDLFFLKSYYDFYSKKLSTFRFIIYSVMYPFHTVYLAITGLTFGYTWKGRYFRQTL
jgi:poly-beta-1,6-N-acetyl-D-glucosamine synthase